MAVVNLKGRPTKDQEYKRLTIIITLDRSFRDASVQRSLCGAFGQTLGVKANCTIKGRVLTCEVKQRISHERAELYIKSICAHLATNGVVVIVPPQWLF